MPRRPKVRMGIRAGDDVVPAREGEELRILTLKREINRAQRLVRRHVKPGVSLADELIAERRGTRRRVGLDRPYRQT